MKAILEEIVKNLVSNTEEVQINEIDKDKLVVYEIKVAKEDMGKIIGKQGKIAKSIRIVMKAICGKEGKKVAVEFVD